jgi:hypothetical protein
MREVRPGNAAGCLREHPAALTVDAYAAGATRTPHRSRNLPDKEPSIFDRSVASFSWLAQSKFVGAPAALSSASARASNQSINQLINVVMTSGETKNRADMTSVLGRPLELLDSSYAIPSVETNMVS